MKTSVRRSAALVGLVFGLTACSEGNVFSLSVGDCFNDTDEIFGGEVSDVPLTDCAEPHDNEVYFIYQDARSSFPGEDAMTEDAFDRCLEEFEGYVGRAYDTSRYDIFPITPTRESWDKGDDREVLCALYDVDLAQLTGSARGSGE